MQNYIIKKNRGEIMITKYEYVSFDLYDTLIFRTVEVPQDVFRIIPILFNERNEEKINEREFYINRIYAERVARSNREKEDVNLDEIYRYLEYPSSIKKILKNIEIEFEINNCVINEKILPIIKSCIELKKKIIVTTDMYLPRICIEKILEKVKIPYVKVYISSEVGLTKLSGHLYDYILNDLKIDSSSIIHYGDNLVSDIENAKSKGIEAIVRPIRSVTQCYLSNRSKVNPGLNHLIKISKLCSDGTVESRIGKFVIALVLVEFCHWIKQKKEKRQIDKLYFIAREGYLIKKIYEKLFPEDLNSVFYLRLNKNMLRLPALFIDPSVETLVGLLPDKSSFTWKQIIELLLIKDDIARINETFDEKNIKLDVAKEILRRDILEHKYDDIIGILLKIAHKKISEQYELLFQYLQEYGCFDGKIAVINNSINGNAQIRLEEICLKSNWSLDVIGLQFVKSLSCENKLGNKVEAWLSADTLPMCIIEEFKFECILFEHMLFENVGTAKCIRLIENKTEAVLDDLGLEYKNTEFLFRTQKEALYLIDLYNQYEYVPIGQDVVNIYLNFKKSPFQEDCKAVSMLIDKDFDGEKKLIEEAEFKKRYLLIRRFIPRNILWIHGYFAKLKIEDKFLFDVLNLFRYNKLSVKRWGTFIKYRILDSKIISLHEKMQLKKKKIKEVVNAKKDYSEI